MNCLLKLSALTALLATNIASAESVVSTTIAPLNNNSNAVDLVIEGDAAKDLYVNIKDPSAIEQSSGRGFELTIKSGSSLKCRELVLLSILKASYGEVEKVKYECTTRMTENGDLH